MSPAEALAKSAYVAGQGEGRFVGFLWGVVAGTATTLATMLLLGCSTPCGTPVYRSPCDRSCHRVADTASKCDDTTTNPSGPCRAASGGTTSRPAAAGATTLPPTSTTSCTEQPVVSPEEDCSDGHCGTPPACPGREEVAPPSPPISDEYGEWMERVGWAGCMSTQEKSVSWWRKHYDDTDLPPFAIKMRPERSAVFGMPMEAQAIIAGIVAVVLIVGLLYWFTTR